MPPLFDTCTMELAPMLQTKHGVIEDHTEPTMCFPALWKLDMIALFQICLMVCLYFIPLGLMACLYTHIAVVLWKKRIPGTANLRLRATTSNSHSQENNTCRLTGPKKAIKMLGAIVTVFALCFLPNHTLNILRYTKQLKAVPNLRMIALISHWCMFFNSCINPIIYNFMSDKFRSEFRVATALCCLRGRTRRLSVSRVMYRMTTLYTRNATGQNSKTTLRITKDNP
ncbi:orexin/Hypocretin receptor type 1-like [Mya arenaria]|uniref:orexin/Hypocretin receptor type 1-like n=1 Tax=Mya arenaria TaxID=6604 RepID=UPI0022E9498E|nr:orexin/Hypocretin receptor type 1-like [Mya arenaria]